MKIIKQDQFGFLIPDVPTRYRANCAREWGLFVSGETGAMTAMQASEAGLTKGNFVELALCLTQERTLSFEPNYINEPFTEIWGIPTAGGMKDQFGENASELSTFLLHRQSKDRMGMMLAGFGRQAFNAWVNDGMQANPEEFALTKMTEFFFTHIFRFEMVQTEGKYGTYFYVQATCKPATSPLELAAIKAAQEIYQGHQNGLGYCTDPRIEDNEIKCLAQQQVEIQPVTIPAKRALKASKTK